VGLQTRVIILMQLMALFMHLHLPTLEMQAMPVVMGQSMAQTMGIEPVDWTVVFETTNVIIANLVNSPKKFVR
jgi:hypothetical protein